METRKIAKEPAALPELAPAADEFLDTAELLKRLHISERELHRRRKEYHESGKTRGIPCIRSGTIWLYYWPDVRAFLLAGR
jgi:hypothetical protein